VANSGIAENLGVDGEVLRGWVRRAEADQGRRHSVATDERERLPDPEPEVEELRRGNEVVKAAQAAPRLRLVIGGAEDARYPRDETSDEDSATGPGPGNDETPVGAGVNPSGRWRTRTADLCRVNETDAEIGRTTTTNNGPEAQ